MRAAREPLRGARDDGAGARPIASAGAAGERVIFTFYVRFGMEPINRRPTLERTGGTRPDAAPIPVHALARTRLDYGMTRLASFRLV